MLVLSRKKGESLMIGDDIELVLLEIDGDQVKIGINAPKQVGIFRKEVYTAIRQSNEEASKQEIGPSDLSRIFRKK